MAKKHSDITENSEIHVPKGFTEANNNTMLTKNSLGALEYQDLTLIMEQVNIPEWVSGTSYVAGATVYTVDNKVWKCDVNNSDAIFDAGKWTELSPTEVLDASAITYTPSTTTDWNGDVDPGNADDALDQLASRVDTLENAPASLLDPMTTRGDIIVRDAANTTSRLPAGTADQVLTSDGTDVSWQSLVPDDIVSASDVVKRLTVTGLVNGGELTINADPATFDLAAGTGCVVDSHTNPDSPTLTHVSWNSQTAVVVTNLATSPRTNIAIDINGNIVQQEADFSTEQQRDLIILGRLVHSNNTSISSTLMFPHVLFNQHLQVSDFMEAVGPINVSGNVFSAGGGLSLNKSAGSTYRIGTNYANKKSPNITTDVSATGLSFAYRYQDGLGGISQGASTAVVDPSNWDDGSGVLATVASNRYSVQRIYFFGATNNTFIMYGQAIYNTLAEAEGAISLEEFNADPNFADATFRGWLVVKGGTTDLTNPSQAKFIQADKFGSSAIAGASASTTTLQKAYDNSDDPEILLSDTALGALTIRDSATNATRDAILDIQDGASSSLLSVDRTRTVLNNKVGIGTTAPQSALHINGGTGSLATGLTFGDGDTGMYEGTDDQLRLHLAGSDRYTITTSNFFASTANSFWLRNSFGSAAVPTYTFNGDTNTGMYSSASDHLNFSTGGVERLVINETGAVGVGIDPFQVGFAIGNTGGGQIRLYRDDVTITNNEELGTIQFQSTFGAGLSGSSIRGEAAGSWAAGSSAPGRMKFRTVASGTTAQADRLMIDSDGGIFMYDLKAGATAVAAGAGADELWVTSGHSTLPDGVVMKG